MHASHPLLCAIQVICSSGAWEVSLRPLKIVVFCFHPHRSCLLATQGLTFHEFLLSALLPCCSPLLVPTPLLWFPVRVTDHELKEGMFTSEAKLSVWMQAVVCADARQCWHRPSQEELSKVIMANHISRVFCITL